MVNSRIPKDDASRVRLAQERVERQRERVREQRKRYAQQKADRRAERAS